MSAIEEYKDKAANLTAEDIAFALQDANGSVPLAANSFGLPYTPFSNRYRALRAEVNAILAAAAEPAMP